ncbi:glycosyltransferase [uncultured Sphingomonas sp.]|uniref:glycosyltransferase n=1 Tax=uncultured Sphingomonas sp. TaxID=158754 RepID=UPI00259713DA|nr:glycosyltransferase [uncultured Sphingomonas sp.]
MRIVVSAVNFSEGGPLTVLRDCLSAARSCLHADTEIIALVHRAQLIDVPGIRLIEYPDAKSSWFRRIVLEYRDFRVLSRELRPDFWLSLHDVSPRLDNGVRQAVYCHNPVPFFRPSIQDVRLDPTLLAFRLAYRFFYRFNIHSNAAVVVQQEWLRTEFVRRFGAARVIVAHPDVTDLPAPAHAARDPETLSLLYPTVPRGFKNIELLCEAIRLLPPGLQRRPELVVTIDGTENSYARFVVDRYGDLPGMRFVGRQSRAEMARRYAEADALLFPSRLETWGLPITEAKQFDLPMIVAEQRYARETVGNYHSALFLPADRPDIWSSAIAAAAQGQPSWKTVKADPPAPPFAQGWAQLWSLLLS